MARLLGKRALGAWLVFVACYILSASCAPTVGGDDPQPHPLGRRAAEDSASMCIAPESSIKAPSHRWQGQIVPYSIDENLQGDEKKKIVSAMLSWEKLSCYIFIPRTDNHYFVSFEENGTDRCCIQDLIGTSGGYQSIHVTSCSDLAIKRLIGFILGSKGHHNDTNNLPLVETSSEANHITEEEGRGLLSEDPGRANLDCEEKCGETISARVTTNGTGGVYGRGNFHSPGYPSNYPSRLDCYWKIVAPDGYTLKVKFRVLDIEPPSPLSKKCDYDYLNITNLDLEGGTLRHKRFCDSPELSEVNSDTITREVDLETAAIVVYFHSDDTYTAAGFSLDYEILERVSNYSDPCSMGNGGCGQLCNSDAYGRHTCSCREGYILSSDKKNCQDKNECGTRKGGCQHRCHNTEGSYLCLCSRGYRLSSDSKTCIECNLQLNSSFGVIESPNHPAPYPHMQNCMWTITPWPNHRIRFTINYLDILSSWKCKTDYLKVQHGHFRNQRRLCSHFINVQYYIDEATEIRFRSRNENVHHSGFRVSYKQVPERNLTPLELNYVLVNARYVPYKRRDWLQVG